MVGEDRNDGPESAMRMGHIDQGPAALMASLKAQSAGCSDGGKCACAAYLETGDRDVAGPVGLWLAAVCKEIGAACADAIGKPLAPAPGNGRRPFLIGLAAAAGLSVGVPLMIRAGLFGGAKKEARCKLPKKPPHQSELILGDVGEPASTAPPQHPTGPVPGDIGVVEDPPDPDPAVHVRGEMRAPEPAVKGNVGRPYGQLVDGDIGAPSDE